MLRLGFTGNRPFQLQQGFQKSGQQDPNQSNGQPNGQKRHGGLDVDPKDPGGAGRGGRPPRSPYMAELQARGLSPQGSKSADYEAVAQYDRERGIQSEFNTESPDTALGQGSLQSPIMTMLQNMSQINRAQLGVNRRP